jgi:hypothetical protein
VKLAHQIWLQNHPTRDVVWLKERFADGFHIHHIDGDAENNDIDNLVLIDGADHMRIHQRKKLGRPTQVGMRLTKKRLSRIMRQYEEAKRQL